MTDESLEQFKARMRQILTQAMDTKISVEEGVAQTLEACARLRPDIQQVERRQWKRKDFSAQATMRIVSGLETNKASRAEKVLVTNISQGGIRIQTPFLSLDNLHIIGEVTDTVWRPNLLDIQLELPSESPQKVSFQGNAEWYLRTGKEPYYLVGISINLIKPEDRKRLIAFLNKEGVEP